MGEHEIKHQPCLEGYAYDNIGNATFASTGAVTNTYTANGLNQYVAVCTDGVTVEPVYDADGNLTTFGDWSYDYDSAARLTEVRSNGVLVASNVYDHLGRRVRLVTQSATHTFIYDGWNVVLELVEHDGVTDRIEYYWGRDLSGTLQGAGGVGGLLYLKRNGSIFVPIYDAYGNVMEYRTANGSLAAAYVYDSFGRTISQTGPLADAFRFRYSTKSYERETGLYYYGKRFYSPILRRWLGRDPLQERGGLNLLLFCNNSPLSQFDIQGELSYGEVLVALARATSLSSQISHMMLNMSDCLKTVYEWFPGHARDSEANDKYKHCVASCEISNACGSDLAALLGLIKELQDIIRSIPQNVAGMFDEVSEMKMDAIFNGDRFEDSFWDLTADGFGIGYSLFGRSCECACSQRYDPKK